MSRKDPRCRMVIPLTAQDRAVLRVLARGGSLGDVLRRIVQQELAASVDVLVPVGVIGGGLPLQLPRKTLAQVSDLAEQAGCSKVAVVRALLYRGLARSKGREDLCAGDGFT